MSPQKLDNCILQQKDRVFELQRLLTSCPALGPANGGQGEAAKAALIQNLIPDSAQVIRLDSPDPRVETGHRPNIIALFPGKSERRLWLFGHMDVVPPGDGALWRTNPWQAHLDGDLIFGRGVEDNQQAIASMLILAEALQTVDISPDIGLGLVFMADEENGSKHGLGWILKQAGEMFRPDDLFIVPDGGSPDAAVIEIAEKGQLWLKFTVHGRQCHASMPQNGNNAFLAASELVCALDNLNHRFDTANQIFLPPASTFVPTRHDQNVDAINILPGKDVFYLDCRILPEISQDAVLKAVGEICAGVAKTRNVEAEFAIVHSQSATFVDQTTPLLPLLVRAIKEVYHVDPRLCGIGGATVAALLRAAGLPAVVWACLHNTCHQPNECSSINATLRDACVFGHILLDI